ncbi:MAG: argininosuccinate lyase [Elusimicrobia bacterium RIFOXYB2_FULL_50_12]|nr:MAG: argininosuccinate lyase [Elusimicrobia bacterium RIFOXYB2_FULL_50_12]
MDNAADIIDSFSFDYRLAPYDIEGSVAHVMMLVKQRIIPAADGRKILNGLAAIAADIKKGKHIPPAEDIHYAVERELIRRIGPVGGKMHTARSRNDQVALDLRLYVRERIGSINALLVEVEKSILSLAEKNQTVIMPGYTHMQPAQPVLFAHHILAYGWMFQRDRERLADCLKRVISLPLGSAALAGTSFPIDRAYVAGLLGFDTVSDNSMDAVSDRDFAVEFVAAIGIVAMHLSRLCEELVIWASAEFGFVRLPDKFTSGSSIMPQKRNPDVAEIIRGKTGRIYGSLLALLTLMKGLPLAYNRDMQEDKPPVFDAADSISVCLEAMAPMLASMDVAPLAMARSAGLGYTAATELADYLVRKGQPFRQAHGIVKALVAYCIKNGKQFRELSAGELNRFSPLLGGDALEFVEPEAIVSRKTSAGGTSPASVKKQISKLKKFL